jgi:hypothetical protein
MVSWAFGKNVKLDDGTGYDPPNAPRKQDLDPADDDPWSDSEESSSIDDKLYGDEFSEGIDADFERELSNGGSAVGSGRGTNNLLDVTGAQDLRDLK